MTQFVHPEFLRIGDTERDQALSALSEHFAQGRLTSQEFDQRSEQVWSARTTADLRPLFSDLPGGLPVAAPLTPVAGSLPVAFRRRRRGFSPFWGIVFALAVLITVASHPWVLAVAAAVWLFSHRR